ncbi:hypothetical protein [Robertmurraya andreesenii]|uniref:Amino acid transporter n=1 Tax=Anoxybacillus andreesenii TaxID=1325932 RepID=A0ABT9V1B8_9BACL|nr:hypothetical protein [Robertmurraya andreesenii]MDQ0154749.1 amino acid transporter [Robertmurraya andreesenii]
MQGGLAYIVSFIVILISVFITLYFKSELERMFREKKQVVAFHICNVLITLMISFAAHAVTVIYILQNKLKMLQQMVILLFIILPVYVLGHFAYEKYKFINRKYQASENGKVLVINEKYLRRK